MSDTVAVGWHALPSVPPRPVFEPDEPEIPGKVACRRCDGWTDLGPDPVARLRSEWSGWAAYVQDRLSDPTRPFELLDVPAPTVPNKVNCRCGHWVDLGGDPVGQLRAWWPRWVDETQDRADVAWQQSEGYRVARAAEAQAAAQHQQELRDERQREAERQQRADEMLDRLVAWGMPATDARQRVRREYEHL